MIFHCTKGRHQDKKNKEVWVSERVSIRERELRWKVEEKFKALVVFWLQVISESLKLIVGLDMMEK